MANKLRNRKQDRRGAVVVLVGFMMVVLVAMVAVAVDYGWILKVRTDMQRSADAAALAAVQNLVPNADGSQDTQAARQAVRDYVASNLQDTSFNVADQDIETGRYQTSTVYSDVTLLNSGMHDAVRVTLRRDGATNPRIGLYFGRAIGVQEAAAVVSATAVLQKASRLGPGANVLPFAVHVNTWNDRDMDDEWSIFGDGKVRDEDGDEIPGNWGTVDIGPTNNSTSDLRDQIENGLSDADIQALFDDGRISSDTYIDGTEAIWMEADTGLSSGMQSAIQSVHNKERIVPLYDQTSGGSGDNAEFRVVGWGVVTVVGSNWNGNNNTHVTIRKAYTYDGNLASSPNSLNQEAVIEGAYTSPALVE